MAGWMDIHERACHWLGGWLSLLHKTYLAQLTMNGKDQEVAVNQNKTFIERQSTRIKNHNQPPTLAQKSNSNG